MMNVAELSPKVPGGKSPPTLPDELWAYIGRFLSKSELAKSYSISPIFFDLWMKTAFAAVKICSMKDQTTLRILCTMTAVAARYVSRLTLCPQFFQLGEITSSFSRLITQRQAVSLSGKLKGLISAEKIPKSVAVQALLGKITQMTNLRTMVVECIFLDEPQLFGNVAVFLDAVKVHADRLENLEINVPMECLEDVLTATPYCAALQSLSLTFEGNMDPTRGETLWEKATHLISLHSATLRRIMIFAARVSYSALPIFSGLEHLPNLTEASFLLFADYFTPQHKGNALLETFLKTHSKQLRGLELCILHNIAEVFNNSPYYTASSVFLRYKLFPWLSGETALL
ncbi:hypothetical protein CPB83DRAFT_833424 [Crepidotus variabilis]|uniref:Uncharacterized protein n=1 Tax=Crepidotus variabilis TaxID=179855 RepID=A0A9P6JTC0_9AGAR|nr:hypothetical protein CPB83DRAFT_833424 [Crepidotus variabilis]